MKTNNSNTAQGLFFCFVQDTRLVQNEKLFSSVQEGKRLEKVLLQGKYNAWVGSGVIKQNFLYKQEGNMERIVYKDSVCKETGMNQQCIMKKLSVRQELREYIWYKQGECEKWQKQLQVERSRILIVIAQDLTRLEEEEEGEQAILLRTSCYEEEMHLFCSLDYPQWSGHSAFCTHFQLSFQKSLPALYLCKYIHLPHPKPS